MLFDWQTKLGEENCLKAYCEEEKWEKEEEGQCGK